MKVFAASRGGDAKVFATSEAKPLLSPDLNNEHSLNNCFDKGVIIHQFQTSDSPQSPSLIF